MLVESGAPLLEAVVAKYGVGNVFSVRGGLERAGFSVTVASEPDELRSLLRSADLVVLPGMGAYPAAMRWLSSVRSELLEALDSGTALLGICLGMQLLFEYSLEWGRVEGLGLLPGYVAPLEARRRPHIAWSRVRRLGGKLLPGDGLYYYFAHGYYCRPRSYSSVTGVTEYYGVEVPAVIEAHPVYGTQFHPEKSGEAGAALLSNLRSELRR